MADQSKSHRAEKSASSQPRQLTRGRRILLRVVTPIFARVIKVVWAFFRIELQGEENFRELVDSGKPVVFAIWHEGLVVIGWFAARLLGAGVKATFLISPSVDGEFGVYLLAWFGGKAVRGSGRRSGAAALRGLNKAIRVDGQSPFIAVDGSKGPRRYCKHGATTVARMAGVPIMPIGFAAGRSWRLRTWDRHLLPKPFSKVVITVGEPITVPRQLDEEAQEAHRRDLESKLNQLMKMAEKQAGTAPGAVPVIENTEEDR